MDQFLLKDCFGSVTEENQTDMGGKSEVMFYTLMI